MKCPKCSKELYDGAVMCPYCRTQILTKEQKKPRDEKDEELENAYAETGKYKKLYRANFAADAIGDAVDSVLDILDEIIH